VALPPLEFEATVTGALTFTGAFAETDGLAEALPTWTVATDCPACWLPAWL
jgi:hypothetical protein